MTSLFSGEDSLLTTCRLHAMRIRVDRHDRVTKIVLDEGEILATGSVVAVHVGLLSEDGPELSVGVRTDHVLLDVLNKFVFVLL